MAKWTYQVLLAEIDSETEENFSWYYPTGPSETHPEFDSPALARTVGEERYPGCQVRAVSLDVHVDRASVSPTP